jgi:hypothetical protein
MKRIERTIYVALIATLISICGFIFLTAPSRAQDGSNYKVVSASEAFALDCESGSCHESGWILVGAVANSSGKPTALLFRSL